MERACVSGSRKAKLNLRESRVHAGEVSPSTAATQRASGDRLTSMKRCAGRDGSCATPVAAARTTVACKATFNRRLVNIEEPPRAAVGIDATGLFKLAARAAKYS